MSDTLKPEAVQADFLASELAASMPKIAVPPEQDAAEKVTEAAAPAGSGPGTAQTGETDSLGRVFDATKFRREKDKLGRWKNLFAGRGGKAAAMGNRAAAVPQPPSPAAQSFIPDLDGTAPGEDAPPAPAATPAEAPEASKAAPGPDRFALLADVYTRAGIAGAMGLFSEEWAPDDQAEYAALRDSVAAYLRATNRDELSPGAALGFALLTYGAKRLPRPKTQSRLAYFRDKLAAWWKGRRIASTVATMSAP